MMARAPWRFSRRGAAVVVMTAVMGIALAARGGSPARAALQTVPAPGAQDSKELYQDVYSGWKWWHVYCYRCHGTNAVGGALAPNLTDPNEKLTLKEFLKKVREGSPDKGMQAWDKLLDDKQITQLYWYVRARADKVLPPGRPDEVGPNGGPWVPPEGWPRQK
jgi:mono/diheme cytochrome c family protein